MAAVPLRRAGQLGNVSKTSMPRQLPGGHVYDVAIIGGGVVGCAAARAFALAGASVILIEKSSDILSGASKANSAILHTGFDAPTSSLELDLVKAGRAEYLEIREQLNLPLVETGALVCAWTPDEADKLEAIAAQARDNGIGSVDLLTKVRARRKAPRLSDRLVAALEVPGEHVIDPWSAPLAYLQQAVELGATFLRDAELISGTFTDKWQLATTAASIRAKSVVNAAGLYGDLVDTRLGLVADFVIKPRKGQFVVLDKSAIDLVPCIILPVPNEVTKGIVICPTAFGNVLVGPTAEEQEDRVRAAVDTQTLDKLLDHAAAIVPALRHIPVTATYAGLRPASDEKAYRIFDRPEKRAITLGGIRSTGLSAALGLARLAVKLLGAGTDADAFATNARVQPVPNISECRARDWQKPDHGEIVCHCELVTRREIEATFDSLVPPGDFGGLRRRTRAGMGRCQGFYCNARLADMTKGRFRAPLAIGTGRTS
jgi:glycerol-3-phosphate dehydrogenase